MPCAIDTKEEEFTKYPCGMCVSRYPQTRSDNVVETNWSTMVVIFFKGILTALKAI